MNHEQLIKSCKLSRKKEEDEFRVDNLADAINEIAEEEAGRTDEKLLRRGAGGEGNSEQRPRLFLGGVLHPTVALGTQQNQRLRNLIN